MRAARRRWTAFALWWALLACCLPAWAQGVTASLDRQRIAQDETVTLTIDADISAVTSGMPDLNGVLRDFNLVGQTVEQDLRSVGGGLSMILRIKLVLRPMRSGEIDIPPLRIGRVLTPPLHLTVTPPRAAPPDPAQAAAPAAPEASGEPVFIRTKLDTTAPYVQQTVGYTMWLYYELGTLLEGRLDQDPPDGASLQKVGDDRESVVQIGRRNYNVVERRFLLIPERAGRVTVPAPRFLGRISGGFGGAFGSIFGGEDTRVRGPSAELAVKPIPAGAPQPWLPFDGLQLRYVAAPRSARVGETALVTVQAVVDGAVAAQLPELALRADGDAQVFPESAQTAEDFVDGRPQATMTRRFAVLPTRTGTLHIRASRITWWDATAGVSRIAVLPDIVLPVAAAAAPDGGAAAVGPTTDTVADDDGGDVPLWRRWMPDNVWTLALLPLGALWLISMAWGWRLWSNRHRPARRDGAGRTGAPAAAQPDPRMLATALARGDRAAIERVLCGLAPARDLDGVRARLADPAQRAAVEALQRARWGDGDPAAAMAAMRAAFAQGPRWWPRPSRRPPSLLPPLYPER
ncbi:MAG: BatD family protein [Xanthomonadales bacterium]|nr:BatD family protein [Xanthomonadales bacterium]